MPARIGKIGELVADLTNFGWMIMSPGKEYHDYKHLYRLDVLGLANTSNIDQYTPDTEF